MPPYDDHTLGACTALAQQPLLSSAVSEKVARVSAVALCTGICQILQAVPAVNYTAANVSASEHSVNHGNMTWNLYTAQADYDAASAICTAQGHQLLSIHSDVDNAAAARLAAQNNKHSVGFLNAACCSV